ncbi:hypothetical protein ACM64Y_08190 [Novispirillum sp. DQ9]|uniref:hypothetical protein n=1 Tax=Novispirillum sp. DQ9 TaxID=3398612 RepID=UPI003C7E0BFC
MFDFLEGFSYGLFLSCFPWFILGMVEPRLAVPVDPPGRLQVILRYWFLIPFLAFVLWLTSLPGGLWSPTVGGWLAGLAAIAIEVPLERRFRRWRAGRRAARAQAAAEAARAAQERAQREAGVIDLDPSRPPAGADDVVLALCDGKRRLLEARRADLALQADRLYARYAHVTDVLRSKFDERELTFARSRGLVAEVTRGAVDNLTAMASLARGVAGVDADFVRRRLSQEGPRLSAEEREALRRRLDLVDDTERRLRDLVGRNEATLTALDDAAVAVARVETAPAQASVAAETALSDLRRFVDKAALYGRSA